MSWSRLRKAAHKKNQKPFELLYKGEHVAICWHLNAGSTLGFVYSGKWPDWIKFAQFFSSRDLSVPQSGNKYLTARELSPEEFEVLTTNLAKAQLARPAEKLSEPQETLEPPTAQQLDLLQFVRPPEPVQMRLPRAYEL